MCRLCLVSRGSSSDNDVSQSPSRSAGLSPEHHLQSIVWVKQAQLNACEGKDSTQKPTVGKKACMAHCLLKPNHSQVWTLDTLVSLGERWKDGEDRDRDTKKRVWFWGKMYKTKIHNQTLTFKIAANSEGLFVALGYMRTPRERERERNP